MLKLLVLTSFVFLIGSCASSPKRDVASLKEPSAELSVDLETLVTERKTGREMLALPTPQILSSEKMSELKKSLREKYSENQGSPKAKRNRELVRSLSKGMKTGDFKNFSTATLDEVLKAGASLRSDRIVGVIDEILAQPSCQYSASFSLAFASMSERQFPDPAALSRATQLYQRTFDCGSGELKARAAYRLGLFNVVDGKCEASMKYWPVVRETPEAKFLFSRAQYWQNHCVVNLAKGSSDRKTLAVDLYKEFPLSFHGLKELEDEGESASLIVKNNKQPRALVRTSVDPAINTVIEQVEIKIEQKRFDEAKSTLSVIPDDSWKALEPHFLLYVSHLASLSRAGLVTFQSLARALSVYPELKTVTTMRLFYPKWYEEEIFASAKKYGLDPLLVMALIRQESAFERTAISPVGARGLMQIMPGTARLLARGTTKKDLMRSELNVELGSKFVAQLLKRFDGNLVLALAAYNAGPGVVKEWKERYKVENPLLFKDLIPYRETREYVASILRNWYWYQVLESENPPKPLLAKESALSSR